MHSEEVKGEPAHTPCDTVAWMPLREDGTIPYWCCTGPRVFRLPDLGSVITPSGSAFGRYGRGWIANAPLSLPLKQRVFDALPSLLPDWPDITRESLLWAKSIKLWVSQDEPPASLGTNSSRAESIHLKISQAPRHAAEGSSPSSFEPVGGQNTPVPRHATKGSSPSSLARIEETPEDGCVDFSRFSFVPEYYDAFACCLIDSEEEQEIESLVPVLGPYGVAVNGKWILNRNSPFGYVEPEWVSVRIPLRRGVNQLVLFGQMIGWREARIVLGMRILEGSGRGSGPGPGPGSGVNSLGGIQGLRAGIPLPEGNPSEWKEAEELRNRMGFRQFCFPDGKVSLYIGKGLSGAGPRSYRQEVEVKLSLPWKESPVEWEESDPGSRDWAVRIDLGATGMTGESSGKEPADPDRKVILEPDKRFLDALRKFSPQLPLDVRVCVPAFSYTDSYKDERRYTEEGDPVEKWPPIDGTADRGGGAYREGAYREGRAYGEGAYIEGQAYRGGAAYGSGPVCTVRRLGKVYLPRHPYAEVPSGDYDSRKRQALEVLSEIEEAPLGALAALALHRREKLGARVLGNCIDFLTQRRDCADFYALALIAALYSFGGESGGGTKALRAVRQRTGSKGGGEGADRSLVARLPTEEVKAIQKALLGFKYWHDEPGVDAMCWFTENHQIIFHTAGYLAGSLFPGEVFTSSGVTGRKLAERCARRLLAWILPRLQGGYSEWDSNTYLAMDIYALLALAEYAPSERIRRLAVTLLDKTFFMIACQSIRGAHGCSHGRCYTEGLKTARVESTSGLQRVAWGMGGFNGETWATGMLALAERYRVHPLVQAIGADMPPLLETRSCSHGNYYLKRDLRQGSWEVHTLTRRTPHYLLSAALDHRPGEPGIQEHLWQLTFSPEAVLFTTWPGNSQEHGNARPNYWAGSARLPRVALEGRSLLCLYDPEGKAGLRFGHAYCPKEVFDEVAEREGWVFVRYRKGYGALRSDGDLYWIQTGPHAYQELRSKGGGRVFLAAAGSVEEDGDFVTFQKKCLASRPSIQADRVLWNTLEGQTLEFSWAGPFRVDGEEKRLRFPWHYNNQYTATPLSSRTMVLQKGDETLTLELAP